nr:aminopeptidase P family N-terminal domain-containing protein [Rhizobiaceae bacterium]
MALHFDEAEYENRKKRLLDAMAAEKLGAMLLFAQESMYWLTGYDTFGFCFFQCLVVRADGEMRLMTRSADLRQARHVGGGVGHDQGIAGRRRRQVRVLGQQRPQHRHQRRRRHVV